MLLGLATILAGSLARNDPTVSEPTFVGLILLWFFFALAHINHHIESGRIAEGQAKLRSYTELYEKTINGTFLLSSPEQHVGRKLPDVGGHRHGARARPAAPQPRVLQVLPLPRRRGDNRRAGRPTARRRRRRRAARRLGLRLTHLPVYDDARADAT